MANNINIAVNVDDNGTTAKATAEAKKLKQALQDAADTAAGMRVPTATMAARQGVAARAAAAQPGGGASDTNLSRGIGGQTGAGGRDFAAQAQGLGGLVHVYATFAANLFAVSAAYGALSKAADTTNLIKGLDQLGAASGQSLGSLAKSMVSATDGAISLRQAMSSTALATSGGMTSSAILRMTEVAKKASLALGRDMGDSMDRLTKGIVKIQPELLDELGIMTRVIPAQQKYAREMGKSVEALTDFEKRQAFANAVLDEGEKKFGKLDIDSSPYAKLSAALVNLSQNMLELINKGLGPIITLLASSPTALTMAIGTFAGLLLKQAIPALGQYRQGIEALKVESLKKATELTNVVTDAGMYDAQQAAKSKQAFLLRSNYATQSAEIQANLLKEADKLEEAHRAKSEAIANSVLGHQTTNTKIVQKAYSEASQSNIKADVAQTQSKYGMVAAYKRLNEEISISKAGQQTITLADGQEKLVKSTNLLQNGWMRLTGAMTIAATAAFTIIEAYSGILLIIGIVLTGFSLLIDKFSKTTEVNKKLSNASEEMTSSFEMVGKTLDGINAKPFLEKISAESLQAKANEFNQLTDSMRKVKTVYDERSKANQGWLEKLQDTDWGSLVSMMFYGDLNKAESNKSRGWWNRLLNPAAVADEIEATTSTAKNQLIKGLTENIVGAFKNVEGTGAGEKSFRQLIRSTFAISFTDVSDLKEKLGEIPDKLISKGPIATKSIEEISHSMNNAASAANSMLTAWDTASKSFDTALGKLTVTDTLGKLGIETVDVGVKMTTAFGGIEESLASIEGITKDVNKLRFLSPETAKALLKERDNLQAVSKAQEEANAKLKEAKTLRAEQTTKLSDISQGGKVGGSAVNAQKAAIADTDRQIALLEQQKNVNLDNYVNNKLIIKAQGEMYAFGADLLNASILQAFQKSSITLQQKFLSDSTSLAGITQNAKLQKDLIDVEISNLQVTMSLADATRNLTNVQEELAIQGKRKEIQSADFKGNKADEENKLQARELVLGLTKAFSGKTYAELAKLTNPKTGAQPEAVQAAAALLPTAAQKASGQAQIQALSFQKIGIDLDAQKKVLQEKTAAEIAILDVKGKQLQLDKASLDSQQKYALYLTDSALTEKESLDKKILLNEQQKTNLNLTNQIKQIDTLSAAVESSKLSASEKVATLAVLTADKKKAELTLNQQVAKNAVDIAMMDIKNQQERMAAVKTRYDLETSQQKALLDSGIAEAQAFQAIEASKLNVMGSTKAYLESEVAQQNILINLKQADLDLAKQQSDLQVASQAKRFTIGQTLAATNDLETKKQLIASLLIEETIYQEQLKSIKSTSDERKRSIQVIGEYTTAIAKLNEAEQLNSAKRDTAMQDVSALESLGQIDPATAAKQRYMAAEQARQAALEISQKGAEQAKAKEVEKGVPDSQVLAGIQARLDLETKVSAEKKTQNDKALELAKKQDDINRLLADQAYLTETASKFTENMSIAFGDLGSAIGSATEALTKMATDTIKYETERVKLTEQLKYAEGDPIATAKINEDISRNEAKSTQDQLANTTKLIGSTKKFFDQKSMGYKLLGNLEKASAMINAATQAKELAMAASTALAKIGIDIPAIYASFMAQLGPYGAAAAAAAMAAVGINALSAPASTGSMVDMTGKTSEERQKTQGTGGVFGDTEAKTKTITDSLQLLAKNSIEGLNYDNELLKAMRKVADSITGAAKSIYASPGIRSGQGFGTSEGSSSSNNFSLGGFATLAGAGLGYAFAGPLGAGLGSMLGGAINNVLGGMFGGGSSSSNKITSAGLELKGTFKQVMDDTQGSIKQFKDVLTTTHTDGGWFGQDSDSSSLAHQTQELGKRSSQAIADIFGQANQMFLVLGKKTGVSADSIQKTLENYDISMPIDLMNKTGQELVDELNAVIGEKISGAAEKIFTGFEKYRNFGEDYLATVLRVVDANDKVNQSLLSIGHAFSVIGKFDITESLISGAGGLEAFQTQALFFHDNFLSAAEKLAPVQKGVNDQLLKLGVNTKITRDQYKTLVISQDLSTQAGRDMYQSLMELAPGFDMVQKAMDDLASKSLDLEAKIYELIGQKSTAIAIARNKELAAMDASLRPRQIYINALTDEIAIRDRLKAAYDSSNKSVNAAIDSLNNYKNALLGGANSTLTPAQKYADATAMFKATAQAAAVKITTTSTAADIATRDAAVAKLNSVSDSFLTNSQVMNAGTAQYQQDLTDVTNAVDGAILAMGNQLSDSKLQLGFLDTIAAATQTTADILTEYLSAVGVTNTAQISAANSGSLASTMPVPGHAKGGLAQGISIVGENGPELVDFKNPGRVYSNQASNDIFSNKELVEEIKSLRQEVAKLRADQKEQTGYLITSTYDANMKNAEAITAANQDALDKQNWASRSKVKIA